MSESKIQHIINKGNNLVNKIKKKKNRKKGQLIDITKDYDKVYGNETKLKYDNAKEEVLKRWTEALTNIDIENTSEKDLFNILHKIREDVAAENDLFVKGLTFKGGKKTRKRRRNKKKTKRRKMKGRNKKTKQRKRRRKTNKRRRKRSMKGGIRPRTQSEEDAEMRINEQEIPSRTYHEWVEEEHGNLQEFLNRPYISMGDIIFYSSGNQFSEMEWIVVPDSNGNKTLRNYATYETSEEEGEEKEQERPRTLDTNKQGDKK